MAIITYSSFRAGKAQQLLASIKKIYQQSDCRYGSPRIAVELQHQSIQASRPRVVRLMRKHAIRSIIRRKYRVQTADSNHSYAIAESFFKTMKTKLIYHQKFATRKEARLAVSEYIEGWYNRKGRHSSLGYRTLCQFGSLILQKTVTA